MMLSTIQKVMTQIIQKWMTLTYIQKVTTQIIQKWMNMSHCVTIGKGHS